MQASAHVDQLLRERIYELGLTVLPNQTADGSSHVPAGLIMRASANGAQLLHDPSRSPDDAEVAPATVPHDAAVFLQSPTGFEAVANTSGRPWAVVLQHLQMLRNKTERARNAEWVAHCINATKEFEAPTGASEQVWKRGVPTLLELPVDIQTLHPLREATLHRLRDARAIAEAHAEAHALVDEFWTALEQPLQQRQTIHLGQTTTDDGDEIHSISIPRIEEFHGASPWSQCNDLALLPLMRLERVAQNTAELRVRQGRIISVRLCSWKSGDILIKYENPWERPVEHTAPRDRLTDPDDIDFFDLIAPLARSAGHDHPSLLVAFLRAWREDWCEYAPGSRSGGWNAFSNLPKEQRDACLRQIKDKHRLASNVLAAVRGAINPDRRTTHRTRSGPKLSDQADKDAFADFAASLSEVGCHNERRCFAAFLRDWRKHWQQYGDTSGWDGFRALSTQQQEAYFECARREKRLHTDVPALVRRALDPLRARRQPSTPLIVRLANPADIEAFWWFDAKTREQKLKNYRQCFCKLLLDWRQHGPGTGWKGLCALSQDERDAYLTEAIQGGRLNEETRRAMQFGMDPQRRRTFNHRSTRTKTTLPEADA